jgi:hypothetical protein
MKCARLKIPPAFARAGSDPRTLRPPLRISRPPSLAALLLLVVLQATLPARAAAAAAAPDDALPSIAARTRSMQHFAGLLTLYWDARRGRVYLEIPHPGSELLYIASLPYGAGSTDLGLDRGQLSESKIVRFERFGSKVMLVQVNDRFRASSTDSDERLAVRQSFPESVLAGFKLEAEEPGGSGRDSALLVDATDFFERDAHGIAESLAQRQKDGYKLDPLRSSVVPGAMRAFPRNVEVESLLTFTTDLPAAGGFVRDVAPDAHALSVRERQSFVELPGPGFSPRRFDPRAGFFPVSYRDYSAALGAPLDQRFILRHRLVKRDPACQEACEAQQPIQYYVDRGAPEPIRSALVEGARWWDRAFQSAGWAPGTFRVDLLPEGADPMDLRYNIIQWVHRYTRGWSYGYAIADPRTGEIIKGNVTLGSLRGRQDYLIAEALLSPYGSGRNGPGDPMLAMVLARLRQLAAHETGHTLGLAHNFAASSYPHAPEDTVSVMDYPHPWITADARGVPDLSRAYGVGIGRWDEVAIDFGYRQFSAGADEGAALDRILRTAAAAGLEYITDEDARPPGGAHPRAHLWDNGTDPAEELDRLLKIRAAALARFGQNAIRPGMPMAEIEDTLVPLYLLHRYQTEAAIKEIGGLDYRYELRGDGGAGPRIVDAVQQRKAEDAVLRTLAAEFLTLPEALLRVLPPPPSGYERTRESLPTKMGPAFDPVSAAECAADLTLRVLFDRERAARLVEYHARDPGNPSFGSLIEATLDALRPGHRAGDTTPLVEVVREAVYVRAVEALLALAADPAAAATVRIVVFEELAKLALPASAGDAFAAARKKSNRVDSSAVDAFVSSRIAQLRNRPDQFTPAPAVPAPPGMPIGSDED